MIIDGEKKIKEGIEGETEFENGKRRERKLGFLEKKEEIGG
jgi:hypothetical protein